jgi:sialate O-acetylesterase
MANTSLSRWFLSLVLVGGALPFISGAAVRVPNVFSDDMVLQRDMPIVVWGWADPKEKVTVEIGGEKKEAKPNERGEWIAMLPSMKAGGPHVLTVSGANKLAFTNVLIGEVWVCSGQSNMEMGLAPARTARRRSRRRITQKSGC